MKFVSYDDSTVYVCDRGQSEGQGGDCIGGCFPGMALWLRYSIHHLIRGEEVGH